jgi:hypothetical protein
MNASERFGEDGRGWEARWVLFAGDVNVKRKWYPGPDLPRLELQDQATILYDSAIGRVRAVQYKMHDHNTNVQKPMSESMCPSQADLSAPHRRAARFCVPRCARSRIARGRSTRTPASARARTRCLYTAAGPVGSRLRPHVRRARAGHERSCAGSSVPSCGASAIAANVTSGRASARGQRRT